MFLFLILLSTLFHFIFAMSPYDTLLLSDTASCIHLKYTVNHKQVQFASVPLTNTVGQVNIQRSVNLLDPEHYELQYEFTATGEQAIVLNYLEIQMDVNLNHQVMMAEGFQCWSTTKEMDRYSKISAIPGVVSWFTQFNLQG